MHHSAVLTKQSDIFKQFEGDINEAVNSLLPELVCNNTLGELLPSIITKTLKTIVGGNKVDIITRDVYKDFE